MRYLLIFFLFCTTSQVSARDFYLSGNEFLNDCEKFFKDENEGQARTGYCLGFVASVVDTHSTFVGWGKLEKYFCLPESVTQGQLPRIVYKFLKEHPEDLHQVASGLIVRALYNAFPCE